MILAIRLDFSLLFIDILLHSLFDLSLLISNKLSVHILQLVVSKISGNIWEFYRSWLIESEEWSIFKFMSLKWISSNEYNSFVFWVLNMTNPLNSILSHIESELFVSWILLSIFLDILILDKLSLGIFHAPHCKTFVLMIVFLGSSIRTFLNSVSLGKYKFSFQKVMHTSDLSFF
jgi:hypothetical protein